ncbi:hypothetical protein P170DRAFT_352555 [Aspergillus steynii IBT 23096]|uniref:Kinetochore complex Sim4 subunit Fta1-domain-containing protein n=1 Tax=Aspergillus steynii IBT 23096 TaxID=1392250 RepID=A0A2I2GK62_9EURO|nr:uncharacterized protein P170DRAFT_352555 [Aspergillus steynii IBT 23096]PLB53278.1 hypothetical protein P170DRAFT_352555 [Aspergillus steynii IBT 23096]
MPSSPPHHLLNTSWTLHRLSPLHHAKEYPSLLDNPVALKTYATRLRDQISGSSSFSGVSTGAAEDESLSRTGPLKDCTWEILPSLSLLDDPTSNPSTYDPESDGPGAGIAVTLEYENITYKAALLAPTSISQDEDDASTHLPLLMTRFPNPLRQTFLSFLSANFDTYVSNLRLSSDFTCSALEIYVGVLSQGSAGEGSRVLEDLVKELQLTVAFSSAVAPALRSLNVNVPRASLGSFLLRSGSASDEAPRGSVLEGLSDYIRRHLAMDLDLAGKSENSALVKQHVRVSKIACAGFNIAGEGRLKLVGQLRAQTQQDGDEHGSAGDGDDMSPTKKLGLRANEALLRVVVRRAATASENQAS